MGGYDGGAAEAKAAQTFHHLRFRPRIKVRGRFVQQHQRRVPQEGAGERDALRLPGRQAPPALAEHRVEPLGREAAKSSTRAARAASSTAASAASGRARRMFSRKLARNRCGRWPT